MGGRRSNWIDQMVDHWLELRSFSETRGVSKVSVSRRGGKGPGRLGSWDSPGWINVCFACITKVLEHFTSTNYVQVKDRKQREML